MKGIGFKGVGVISPGEAGAVLESIPFANWYVNSVLGNDANPGNTPALAKQTLAGVNAVMGAGDIVGLARGSTFLELWDIPFINITVLAYGGGANPIIDGQSIRTRSINVNVTGFQISDVTCTGGTQYGIYCMRAGFVFTRVFCYDAVCGIRIGNPGAGTLTDCICQNSTANGNFYFTSTGVITVDNCLSNGTAAGIQGFYASGQTGAISFNNCTATGCAGNGNGFYLNTAPTVTFTNCLAYGNYTGFECDAGAAAITGATLTNCYAHTNREDGFGCTAGAGGSSTVNCWYCRAYLNGAVPSATAGDGFTAHTNCTLNLYYCIAHKNFKSGIGVINNASGVVYGCSFYDNYEATVARNSGIYIGATGTWDIHNNITKHHELEVEITAGAVGGGLVLSIDYNCYDDSRGGNAFHYNGANLTYANYVIACGDEANSQNADPLFTAPLTGDFTLQALSPAINGGDDLGVAYDDALDPVSTWPYGVVTRQQNAVWDQGAYGGY